MSTRNLILWTICALALIAMFTYGYHPRQAAAMPHYSGPDRPTPDRNLLH